MKKIFLLLLALPFAGIAQKEYSEEAKLIFEEANGLYASGDRATAYTLYERCLAVEPEYAEAYVNMSSIKFEKKDYKKALELAQKAHSVEKVQKSIFSVLGKAYYMNSEYDSAAHYLSRIIVFDQLTEQESYFLAASRVNIGDFVGAKSFANQLSNNNPKNSDYAALEGNVYYGMGEYSTAISKYEKALKLNPDNTYIYSNIANAYLELNQADKSLEYIEKGLATSKGKDKVVFLILKGNYFHRIEELDNAEEAYNEAFGIDNSNPNILVNQAGIAIDREDYQSALEKCNMAIEKNDQLMEAYYNRGIANEMLRNVEEACADWEEAFILGSEKAEKFLNSSTCNE